MLLLYEELLKLNILRVWVQTWCKDVGIMSLLKIALKVDENEKMVILEINILSKDNTVWSIGNKHAVFSVN